MVLVRVLPWQSVYFWDGKVGGSRQRKETCVHDERPGAVFASSSVVVQAVLLVGVASLCLPIRGPAISTMAAVPLVDSATDRA